MSGSNARYSEAAFETAIEQSLIGSGGYIKGDAEAFDRRRGFDPAVLLGFIQATQPKAWATIAAYHGDQAGSVLLDDLTKTINASGLLRVLRHGFSCFGKAIRIAWFAPASGLNPDLAALYAANVLTVTRQLHFSETGSQSLDLVLSLNGLPLVTAELKNPFTGQTIDQAMRQYRQDRDPKEPIFRFNHRALVHFAVDPDRVSMSTRLDGAATVSVRHRQARRPAAAALRGDRRRGAQLAVRRTGSGAERRAERCRAACESQGRGRR